MALIMDAEFKPNMSEEKVRELATALSGPRSHVILQVEMGSTYCM